MNRSTLAALLATLACLSAPAFADTLTITSSSVASTTFAPSADAVALAAGNATLSAPGSVVFQTGTITIGDSQISDQVIPFFFYDTVTINGVSNTLTIYGQDNVTTSADVISIFAAAPVDFGAYTFTLNSSSITASAIGDIPVQLSADIEASPVPEPGTLPLLATGVLGGAMLITSSRNSILNL